MAAGRAVFGATCASLVLLLGGAGCSLGRLDPDYLIASKRETVVREAAESYGQNLRWGRLNEAAAQVEPESRAAFLALFKDARQPIHFTSFEIETVALGEERGEAEVMVSFDLFRPPSIHERTVRDVQQWHYDQRTGRWLVDPDLSVFKMPPEAGGAGVSSGARQP